MTLTARHSSVALVWGLATLVCLASGCGGRAQVAPPLSAARVDGGALGYQRRLHLNFYMLCEQADGRLRCQGLHPLDALEEGWASFADGFSSVAVGGLMLCGLRAGRVVCWGEDPTGGTGSSDLDQTLCTEHSFHGLTGVRELAMGEDTACVITEAGVVRCWGPTLGPELEDDALHDVLEGARGLAVGSNQGCALTRAGVRCWGYPVSVDEPLPVGETYGVQVPDPAQVVVGEGFACARSRDRRVFCWGYDTDGSLGLGVVSADEPFNPSELSGLSAVDLVASEDSVCARGVDGMSYCWGGNTAGQLGLGHTRTVNTPTRVPALDGAVDVTLAADTMCARFADGGVRCAGDTALLMPGTELNVVGPQRLPGVTATRLHLSEHEACVSTADGLRCFGDGGFLRRGHQEAAAGWTPEVNDAGSAAEVNFHARVPCVRWQDGRLRCDDSALRVEASGTLAFAARGASACFVDATRQVRCWSRTNSAPPMPVAGLTDVATIATSFERVCAVTTHGTLACRPIGERQATSASRLTASLTDVRSVALGGERTCAVRQGGQLVCWEGETAITGEITGVTAVTYGRSQMCVVQGGYVRCLRFDGGVMSLEEPLPGLDNVAELASGGDYLCALRGSGEVWCWGKNESSQLGGLMPTLRLEFVRVPDTEVYPERPASLECQGTVNYDYEEYY